MGNLQFRDVKAEASADGIGRKVAYFVFTTVFACVIGLWLGDLWKDDPPQAMFEAIPDVRAQSATNLQVAVNLTDDHALVPEQISIANISISGPRGLFKAASVQCDQHQNPHHLRVVYSFIAPAGVWSPAENGKYVVTLPHGAITDARGTPVQTSQATFLVDIPTSGPSDAAPQATVGPIATIRTANSEAVPVVVDFADDHELRIDSVRPDGVSVGGPKGLLVTSGVKTDAGNDRRHLRAIYEIRAPAGGWSDRANGTYEVALVGGAAKDSSGQPVAAQRTSFLIDIPHIAGQEAPGGKLPVREDQPAPSLINEKFQADVAVLAIGPTGEIDAALSDALAQRSDAKSGRRWRTGLFTPSFVSGKSFDRLFEGDSSVISNLPLAGPPKHIVLARTNVITSVSATAPPTYTTTAELEFRVIDVASGQTLRAWKTPQAKDVDHRGDLSRETAIKLLLKDVQKPDYVRAQARVEGL